MISQVATLILISVYENINLLQSTTLVGGGMVLYDCIVWFSISLSILSTSCLLWVIWQSVAKLGNFLLNKRFEIKISLLKVLFQISPSLGIFMHLSSWCICVIHYTVSNSKKDCGYGDWNRGWRATYNSRRWEHICSLIAEQTKQCAEISR